MSVASIPLSEAPADPAEMAAFGRWNLRTWAEELGVIHDEASKNAFSRLNATEQAQAVAEARDAAASVSGGKKAKKKEEPPTRTPVKKKPVAPPPEEEEEEEEEEEGEEEDDAEEGEEESEEEDDAPPPPPRKPATAAKAPPKAVAPAKAPPPNKTPVRTPAPATAAKAPPGRTPVAPPKAPAAAPAKATPARTPVASAAPADEGGNPGKVLGVITELKKQVASLTETVQSQNDTLMLVQQALTVTNRLALTNMCVALRLGSLHTTESFEDTLRNSAEEIESVMGILDELQPDEAAGK
jgi:hypothetical protein